MKRTALQRVTLDSASLQASDMVPIAGNEDYTNADDVPKGIYCGGDGTITIRCMAPDGTISGADRAIPMKAGGYLYTFVGKVSSIGTGAFWAIM